MSSASNFLPELNDASSSREDARSNRGDLSPKKLNIQTKMRGKAGGPPGMNLTDYRVDREEIDSNRGGSPITPSKTFGLRNFKRPIDDPRRSNYTTQDGGTSLHSSHYDGFENTMSPSGGGKFGSFKINLQRNGERDEFGNLNQRANNSTLGHKAAGKLLPMVRTPNGGSPTNKRASYQ